VNRPRPLRAMAGVDWPSPRKVLRIARWEVSTAAGTLDRRTALLALSVAVVAILAGPWLLGGNAGLDGGLEDGIYRIGVAEDDPYYAVVESDARFVARAPDAALGEEIDVRVRDGAIRHADSPKGRAAYSAFRTAISNYNDRRLAEESRQRDNSAAAFPVDVRLRYDSRAVSRSSGGGGGGGGSGGGGGVPDGGGGDDDPTGVPDVGGDSALSGNAEGSPGDISPPFPFGSLLLAFLFIVPMNFVIQAYGSTIMDERLNRRGELLLVSPVTRIDIIAGKTLPYFLALAGITVAITAGITTLAENTAEAGLLSVAAVLPIALLFLSATFVGAMFARSFKELTFVTLAISVFLTSYAFVPAIFTEVIPISLISPLTLVVRDLQGTSVSLAEFAFSTGPLVVTSGVLFALGAGVYREEDMFTQRPVPLKALDAMAAWIRGRWTAGVMTAAFVPFVFVAELLAIAILFALPISLSLFLLFLTIAVIEEIAKSAHVYAGFEHDRYGRGLGSAVVVGALSGLGFFVGEKLTIVVQVVGLQQIPLGRAAFPDAAAIDSGVAILLLLAPLALHTVTAGLSAVGASRGKTAYAVAVTVAVFVHLAYNLGVVFLVG